VPGGGADDHAGGTRAVNGFTRHYLHALIIVAMSGQARHDSPPGRSRDPGEERRHRAWWWLMIADRGLAAISRRRP
jgi:hypothetical protein